MEKISLNITLAEATKSANAVKRGLSNVPDEDVVGRMKHVAGAVFERVRYEVCGNKPLAVTSFYRSPAVNRLAGGSASSQHCRGEAMDLDADIYGYGTNRAIFDYIRDNLPFDQLIWEFGNDGQPDWVHVSACVQGNRGQVLRSYRRADGSVFYHLL